MQRKNYSLKMPTARGGIAMVMAISVLVIVATIMALSMSMTTLTTKKTVDTYLYEQAALLAQSATEITMLVLAKSAPCSVDTYNFQYPTTNPIFDINATMRYITTVGSACEANAIADGSNYATTTHPASNGTVIMDITVSVPQDNNITSEPIRYFRRTIQKL